MSPTSGSTEVSTMDKVKELALKTVEVAREYPKSSAALFLLGLVIGWVL